ncbi:aryl hydrocarbon receptor-like isoform 2-T2 [Ara ararauna]
MYAGRKRKKPVTRSPKPPPLEGVKSNPSKRHRDRLNQELNKLTGLLPFPEDVRTRLDKLSILRLTVGYLKVKSYLLTTATDVGDYVLEHPRALGGSRWMDPQVNRELFPEGELLLQTLNGFFIAVTEDGSIFYISPTVQDYLGFHQSDLIQRSVYELIHVDDRAAFCHELHRAPVSSSSQHAFPMELPAGCSTTSSPEEPSFMERRFTCRFRCLLDKSLGFLALRFHGRLKCLHGQQKSPSDRSSFIFFAIATVLQPFSILELRTETLIFQTKHKLDFTPVACDSQDEEGEEHLRKRNLQLPFTFVTGEAILYRNDLPEPLDSFQAKEEPQTQAKSHPKQCLVDPNPHLGPMMKQDASIYSSHADNVLQLIAELDGLSQDEATSDAKDSDSLLVITETLFEKSEEDGNISWTMQNLNMDTSELQQWEDALLSLGAEEKSPVQEAGTEVTSFMKQMLLGQDAGKSMAFPPCNEEDNAAAHLQHCWAAHSVFQTPAQPQAPGVQGQDAVVPLVSISSAQPEQHVLSNLAGLVGGTVLDAQLELANPGQGLQAGVPTFAPMDNTVPNNGIQP